MVKRDSDYSIAYSEMLTLGHISHLGRRTSEKLPDYRLVEEYFLANVPARMEEFSGWLEQNEFESDMTVEANVVAVDEYLMANRECYVFVRDLQGSGLESESSSHKTMLTGYWDSLFLDLTIKIVEDFRLKNEKLYWRVNDFSNSSELRDKLEGRMCVLYDDGSELEEQPYINFIYEAFDERTTFMANNPGENMSVVPAFRALQGLALHGSKMTS